MVYSFQPRQRARTCLSIAPSAATRRLVASLTPWGDKDIKITLIDNPTARNHSHFSSDEIVRLIRDAGHKVNYQSSKEKKWKKAVKKTCDIIAVSGGDGTVGKVGRLLIGSRMPIAILPMGAANNIATTLDLVGKTLPDLIEGWKNARPVNFDAGLVKAPWGSQYFIEGFGIGLTRPKRNSQSMKTAVNTLHRHCSFCKASSRLHSLEHSGHMLSGSIAFNPPPGEFASCNDVAIFCHTLKKPFTRLC